jgi:signal transduction histidine kinase
VRWLFVLFRALDSRKVIQPWDMAVTPYTQRLQGVVSRSRIQFLLTSFLIDLQKSKRITKRSYSPDDNRTSLSSLLHHMVDGKSPIDEKAAIPHVLYYYYAD